MVPPDIFGLWGAACCCARLGTHVVYHHPYHHAKYKPSALSILRDTLVWCLRALDFEVRVQILALPLTSSVTFASKS